jgi:hypothetical protein
LGADHIEIAATMHEKVVVLSSIGGFQNLHAAIALYVRCIGICETLSAEHPGALPAKHDKAAASAKIAAIGVW